MTRILLFTIFILAIVVFGIYVFKIRNVQFETTSNFSNAVQEKPLDKYTIENLSKQTFEKSNIEISRLIGENEDFASYIFYFYPQGLKVSGLLNVPKGSGEFSTIVMFRGYVDREDYLTGVGTQRAGEMLARNNFVTLAPDFLGYGESDNPSSDVMEERFQTYITALTLLSSLGNLNNELATKNIEARASRDKVGIWGHSNGGQIALTILEASGKLYPTVLWAPVSKPFPYSILYYTDDFDDHGKLLRKKIADFEKDYDVEKYSLTNYFEKINAKIQIYQGTADDAVPVRWSNELVEKLQKLNKDVEYFTYQGNDHNFAQGAWRTVVERNILFYRENL